MICSFQRETSLNNEEMLAFNVFLTNMADSTRPISYEKLMVSLVSSKKNGESMREKIEEFITNSIFFVSTLIFPGTWKTT